MPNKLTLQDKQQVAHWLRGGATLAEVRSIPAVGLVGNVRFTERARDLYTHLWGWSAHRCTGFYCVMQDKLFARGGLSAVDTRIARTCAQIERIKKEW